MNLREIVQQDAETLLIRALNGKQVCAFGEDGLGQYGRNDIASWHTIQKVSVCVSNDDTDPNNLGLMKGTVVLTLSDYDSDVSGYIMTDRNFDISLGELMKKSDLNPKSLSWPEFGGIFTQGRYCVLLHIKLDDLLEWL